MRLNYLLIGRLLGFLLVINGLLMMLCLPVSLSFGDGAWAHISIAAIMVIAMGGAAPLSHSELHNTNGAARRLPDRVSGMGCNDFDRNNSICPERRFGELVLADPF